MIYNRRNKNTYYYRFFHKGDHYYIWGPGQEFQQNPLSEMPPEAREKLLKEKKYYERLTGRHWRIVREEQFRKEQPGEARKHLDEEQ